MSEHHSHHLEFPEVLTGVLNMNLIIAINALKNWYFGVRQRRLGTSEDSLFPNVHTDHRSGRATFGPVTWSTASETGPLGNLASLRGGLPGGGGTTMEGGARD